MRKLLFLLLLLPFYTNAQIPNSVKQTIVKHAEDLFPDNYTMQKYSIEQDTKAYIELQQIATDERILNHVQNLFPDNYSMQLYTYKQEAESKEEVIEYKENLKNDNEIGSLDSEIIKKASVAVIRDYPNGTLGAYINKLGKMSDYTANYIVAIKNYNKEKYKIRSEYETMCIVEASLLENLYEMKYDKKLQVILEETDNVMPSHIIRKYKYGKD